MEPDSADPIESTNKDINYSIPLLKLNQYQLQMNRILIATVSGIVSGILRVEGVAFGLLVFIACNLIGSAVMCLTMKGGVTNYFPNGVRDVFLSQNFSGLMTYILVWTLVYDVVHIF